MVKECTDAVMRLSPTELATTSKISMVSTLSKLRSVAQTCDPSTLGAKAGGEDKFETSLSHKQNNPGLQSDSLF